MQVLSDLSDLHNKVKGWHLNGERNEWLANLLAVRPTSDVIGRDNVCFIMDGPCLSLFLGQLAQSLGIKPLASSPKVQLAQRGVW